MEEEEVLPVTEAAVKKKIDEIGRGLRKLWKEEDIQLEKHEHLPTVTQRTRIPEGFYSENWNEALQEEDKWQRIAQMVFRGGFLEINPVVYGYISSSCTQHKRGGCSVSGEKREET